MNNKYKIFNYRTFEDYQYGHGTFIGNEKSKKKAIQIAKMNTYGGREWCSVTDGKEYRAVFH